MIMIKSCLLLFSHAFSALGRWNTKHYQWQNKLVHTALFHQHLLLPKSFLLVLTCKIGFFRFFSHVSDWYSFFLLPCCLQPGPAWRDILVTSGHIGWLLNLYSALRQKFSCEGYWLDCPIAVSARKLIVQFCSLTGTIFPSGKSVLLSTCTIISTCFVFLGLRYVLTFCVLEEVSIYNGIILKNLPNTCNEF